MAPSSIHYENRRFSREHENKEKTTHQLGGRRDSEASASKSRVSSRSAQRGPRGVAGEPARSVSCASLARRASEPSVGSGRMSRARSPSPSRITGRERCYDQPMRIARPPCRGKTTWNHGKYVRDECGSGIIPKRADFVPSRRTWCKTPLSMYQATIGELGRQILCREVPLLRNVRPEPPCNVCEYILPPCRGYYRKYDCLRPCEEEYVTRKQGQKVYRDRVERYWEPCLTKDEKSHLDVNSYAGHNVYLGIRMRRKNVDMPCW